MLGLLLLVSAQTGLPVLPGRTPAVSTPVRIVPTVEAAAAGTSKLVLLAPDGTDLTARLVGTDFASSALTLLPLDVTGRSEAGDDLAGATRHRVDATGAQWLELPNGGGTLRRYLRTENAGSGATFEGLLHLDRNGWPGVVLELETPMAGAIHPFVGVGRDGRRVLAGTSLGAGGDLFDVDLARGLALVRTPLAAPLDLRPESLFVGDGFAFAVAADGPRRFSLDDPAPAALVPTAPSTLPPAFWSGDAAISFHGARAVVLAGTSPTAVRPYVFGPVGPHFPAADGFFAGMGAGYANATTFGPFLTVDDDGRTASFRVEGVPGANGTPASEVFVGRTATGLPPVAASGDAFLMDTLAEIGRVLGSPHVGGGVLFFAGEPNGPDEGGLEAADLLGARPAPGGGLELRNVTNTMGDSTPPFADGVPTLTPARVDRITDSNALVWDDDAGRLVTVHFDATGVVTVLGNVREVEWVESVGGAGAWVAAVEMDTANRERLLVGAAAAGLPAIVLDAGTPTTVYGTPTSDLATGRVLVRRRDGLVDRLLIARPASSQVQDVPLAVPRLAEGYGFSGPTAVVYALELGAARAPYRFDAFTGVQTALGTPRAVRVLR